MDEIISAGHYAPAWSSNGWCPCRGATAHVRAEVLLLAAEISASFLQCSNFTAGGGGSAAAKDEACIGIGFKH